MPRYKIIVEYDGAPFVGWQLQDKDLSVQGALMAAIEAFSGEKVMVQGAGRTDAGVHAIGQVAHFDLATERETDTVRDATQRASAAASGRGAVGREGRSRFRRAPLGGAAPLPLPHRQPPPDLALERGRAWRVPRRLDVEAMHAGAQRLIGKHDFTTFRSTECQAKSPEKTLDRLDVSRVGEEVHRTSPRVRSCTIRCARWSARWCWSATANGSRTTWTRALRARDRAACGPVAPPDGLYLVRVDY